MDAEKRRFFGAAAASRRGNLSRPISLFLASFSEATFFAPAVGGASSLFFLEAPPLAFPLLLVCLFVVVIETIELSFDCAKFNQFRILQPAFFFVRVPCRTAPQLVWGEFSRSIPDAFIGYRGFN